MINKLVNSTQINFICEHWLSIEEEYLLRESFNTHNTFFHSEFSELENRKGRPFGGTVWLIDKDIKVNEFIVHNKHLSSVRLNYNGLEMSIIGVWMPYDDGSLDSVCRILSVFSEIESLLDNIPITEPYIVMGDWNCDINRGRRMDEHLKIFLDDNDLFGCENKFYQGVINTYKKGDYSAHIDHILCPKYLCDDIIKCEILDDLMNTSDHKPIKICIRTINNNTNHTNRNNIYKFHWESNEFIMRYRQKLNIFMDEFYGKIYSSEADGENCLFILLFHGFIC
jgi:hypothetical protein